MYNPNLVNARGPIPTSNTSAVATAPSRPAPVGSKQNPDTLSPAFLTAMTTPSGAPYQSAGGQTFTTPIVSANSATGHYLTAKNALDIAKGNMAGQALTVSQQRAQAAQNAQGQVSLGGAGKVLGTETDNTDLTTAINNANSKMGGTVAGDDPNAVSQISPADLASFRQANPNLPFTQQDLDNYNNDPQTQLNQLNVQRDQAFDSFNQAVNTIRNGTFPLNPQQHALVNSMQQSLDDLRQATKAQADAYTQSALTLGATTGIQRYQPSLQLENVSVAMAKGKAAIADAEINATKALADLEKSFQTDDYNMLVDSYDRYSSAQDKKQASLEKMQANVAAAAKAIQDQADKQQTNAREALNTILTQVGGAAFEDMTPEQQAQIQQLEQQAGWPVGLMKQGLQTMKEKQDLADQQAAQQKLEDAQRQQDIENSFRMATLQISQQMAGIAAQNAGLASQRLALDAADKGFVLGADNSSFAPNIVKMNEDISNFLQNNVKTFGNQPYVTADQLKLYSKDDQELYTKAINSSGGQIKLLADPKDADALDTVETALSNLNSMKALIPKVNPSGVGQKFNPFSGKGLTAHFIQNKLGNNPDLDAYKSYQQSALKIMQGLSGKSAGAARASKFLESISDALPNEKDDVDSANRKIEVTQGMLMQTADAILGVKPTVTVTKDGQSYSKENVSSAELTQLINQGYKVNMPLAQ